MSKIIGVIMLFICAQASAQKTKESYKDIIAKAQNLLLQQERVQASQVILRAIKNEKYNKKGADELIKSLNEVAVLFYTEKAQKIFEYAKTLVKESPQEALEKFQESLKLEQNNILIIQSIARLYLLLGKCEDSEKYAIQALEINPFSSEAVLVGMQSAACLQKEVGMDTNIEGREKLKKELPIYFHASSAQYFYNKGDYLRAQVELQKSIAADKDFAENYYWEAQIHKKLGTPSADSAMKYIRICKTLNKKDYKKYELEPRLCQEYKNIEAEYKTQIEQSQKKDL